MASHDDLLPIIMESLSVVKSIGEDVKAIAEEVRLLKQRMENIEERVGSSAQLPTISDLLSIKETLDSNLKPLDKVNIMDEKICEIQEGISKLRSMDDTPSKSDLLSIKDTLDSKLKPLDQIEVVDGRVKSLEKYMATISKETANPTIHFHSKIKGRNVVLSKDAMCAERKKTIEEIGFAGVITDVPIRADELFNIRIEETIDKWKDCGIAIGVISDKRVEVEGAWSIFLSIKGTWALNSWFHTISGKAHSYKDTYRINRNGYKLDTRLLQVGSVLGMKLRSNGDLHLYINGVDKGVAFENVPKHAFAFVDVLGYVTKISIVKE